MRKINNYPRSFAFRLTEADGERLDNVAAAEGTTSGEWARRIISSALSIAYHRRRVQTRVANADVLRRLIGELNRLGNNCNQVAKRLNNEPSPDALAARQSLEAIREMVKPLTGAILDSLGGDRNP